MPNSQELQGLVQEVAQKLQDRRVSVAVVGDMILDNAIEGVPGGKHAEIGVPIMRDATTQESIGGAANIALALTRLGVDVTLFGIVGSDLPGRSAAVRPSLHHRARLADSPQRLDLSTPGRPAALDATH